MKHLCLSALILIALISCKDEGGLSISPQGLTECPAETNCSYLFSEAMDFDATFQLRSGSYRVFKASQVKRLSQDEIRSELFIKTPMKGKSFSLSDKDIKTSVSLNTSCMLCNMVPLKPLSGTVKGVNTAPDKPADQTQWLLDINVVVGTVDTELPVDTIQIKQYFRPNFIYN